jgi:hypothetical protein
MQRIAAEQRNLEEQQRREREAVAAANIRKNQSHEVNANASPDVKQTLKVTISSISFKKETFKIFFSFIYRHFLFKNKLKKKEIKIQVGIEICEFSQNIKFLIKFNIFLNLTEV